MTKLTVDGLTLLRDENARVMASEGVTRLMVCSGTGCHATGSISVIDGLRNIVRDKGLEDTVQVIETGCNGFCAMGPIMVVHPGDIFYQKLKVDDLPALIDQHIVGGAPVEKHFYKDPGTKKKIPSQDDIPFFAHQMPRALRNKGLIDPESIDDYIGRDGYLGVAKALHDMSPDDIIEEMKKSGLRGAAAPVFPQG